MTNLLFDDIIYKLQRFGGATVYWRNITRLVSCKTDMIVSRVSGHRLARFSPIYSNANILHSSYFRRSGNKATKAVATVHDLNYELGYISSGFGAKVNILERKLSYFSASALICISNSTKSELLDVYPQLLGRCPIYVIHHGCKYIPSTNQDDIFARSLGPFVLHVGGRNGYKRFVDLLEGFASAGLGNLGFRLICTGDKFTTEESFQIHRLSLSRHVLSLGVVSSSLLSALYESAYCLVYPSEHEGFGMPLVEAMQHGCPVIACSISCIPEIVGEAALLVPPRSPHSISQSLLTLSSSDLRNELVISGRRRSSIFTWEASAEAHCEVYHQMDGSH